VGPVTKHPHEVGLGQAGLALLEEDGQAVSFSGGGRLVGGGQLPGQPLGVAGKGIGQL
jgi:hypothetical protein